jgi:hypothetical protein
MNQGNGRLGAIPGEDIEQIRVFSARENIVAPEPRCELRCGFSLPGTSGEWRALGAGT